MPTTPISRRIASTKTRACRTWTSPPPWRFSSATWRARRGIVKLVADITHIAAKGNVVFTERVDHHYDKDGNDVLTPSICGIFEVENGRFKRWADYFRSQSDAASVRHGSKPASRRIGSHERQRQNGGRHRRRSGYRRGHRRRSRQSRRQGGDRRHRHRRCPESLRSA